MSKEINKLKERIKGLKAMMGNFQERFDKRYEEQIKELEEEIQKLTNNFKIWKNEK